MVDGASATPSRVPWGHDWAAGGGDVCVVKNRRMWWAELQMVGSSLRVGSALFVELAEDGIDVGCWEVGSRLAKHRAS
jgi:hypothetical protein